MTVYVQNNDVEFALSILKAKVEKEQIIREYIRHRHPSQRGGSNRAGGKKK